MAGRQLRRWVHVPDDTGAMIVFGPADDVPAWAAAKIINPAAWEADDEAADGPPPKAGRGSGAPAWAEYAAAQGVTVDDDANRDEIIAALDQAGIPTE